jgi:hypothetical protein
MASSIRNNYDDSILVEHLCACSEYCRMVPPNDVSNVAELLSAVNSPEIRGGSQTKCPPKPPPGSAPIPPPFMHLYRLVFSKSRCLWPSLSDLFFGPFGLLVLLEGLYSPLKSKKSLGGGGGGGGGARPPGRGGGHVPLHLCHSHTSTASVGRRRTCSWKSQPQ